MESSPLRSPRFPRGIGLRAPNPFPRVSGEWQPSIFYSYSPQVSRPLAEPGSPSPQFFHKCSAHILFPECRENGDPLLTLNFLLIFTASVPPIRRTGLPLASIFSQVFGSYPFPRVSGGWRPPSNPQFFTHIHRKCPAHSPNRTPPRLNFFTSVRLISFSPSVGRMATPLLILNFLQVLGGWKRPFTYQTSASLRGVFEL
jgi:hypothetical protein